MEAKKDGGQAFPNGPNPNWGGCEGMTLRDYFAGQALPGVISWDAMINKEAGAETLPERAAKYAYRLADEMLKAKESSR